MTIEEAIALKRFEQSGRSVHDLAKHMGKPVETVSRIVAGERRMTVEELQSMNSFAPRKQN